MTLDIEMHHAFPGFALDVDFSAPAGVTALFGRSGAGKTSIVNAVAGLMRPRFGRVVLAGRTLTDTASGIWVPPHRRRIGYVFQEDRLFPHLSVAQNLAYGRGRQRDAGEFDRVVDMLAIAPLLTRQPASLSGGERQRVAIGRALLANPDLLLMDEPLASLDEARKAEILPYLERLRDEAGIPILYVSHSASEVARLATTIVVIHDGRVSRIGAARDILADPEAVPMLGQRDAGAVIDATVARHDAQDGLTELSVAAGRLVLPLIDAAPGTRLRIRIGAHDVIIAKELPRDISALNILPVTVTRIHQGEGPGAAVGLDAGGDHLLARITRRSVRSLNLEPGLACYAIIKSTAIAPQDIGRKAGDRLDRS
ncbi:MAG: molybdenum ABC transporter ATP-binding protein [Rhodobiaceae bacterium]|nr:molybdenum ABC transporter ATP-binding protein [Rhodobiaceae bacterium]MCC0057126.1 molybdenum ABC transporter ATP-binding protein [Rhodobiaceae bacterium]